MTNTTFHTANIDNQNIFYREAGEKNAPVLLLLHGFPSSSHKFRNLIPALAHSYRVIVSDMPEFGFSDAADHTAFTYTFNPVCAIQGVVAVETHRSQLSARNSFI